jgi:hypothetical protein
MNINAPPPEAPREQAQLRQNYAKALPDDMALYGDEYVWGHFGLGADLPKALALAELHRKIEEQRSNINLGDERIDKRGRLNVCAMTPQPLPEGAICGVYLLFAEGEVVYVGQSIDCFARIIQHKAGSKIFDSYFIIPTLQCFLGELEAAYIEKYSPCHNTVKPKDINRNVRPLHDLK